MNPDGIRYGLVAALRLCLGALIVALIGLEAVQVLLRYLFATGMVWGRDVSTLVMFSIAWLGAPLVWLERGHLAVDLLPTRLSRSRLWRGGLDLLVLVAALALLAVTRQAMQVFAFIDMPSLGTSAAVKFWPMTAGAALLAVAALVNLARPQGAP